MRSPPRVQLAALLAALVALAACGEVVHLSDRELELELQPDASASTIVDASGNELAVLRREYRERVELERVPQVLVDAVITTEDQRFWDHGGVDARAVTRAALRNLAAGEVVEGGSTITQQLVELRFMPPAPDTLDTKATEAALALEVEREFSKEWILEEYLNTVYLGGGAHGVGAAAWSYFRSDVGELTLAQAALLAGLVRSPGSADPRVAPAAARTRRDTVLSLMADAGVITVAEALDAAATPIEVHDAPPQPRRREPQVVDLVVRQLLAEPGLGRTETERWHRLTGDGLRIHTTLDPAAQESARAALDATLGDPGDPDGAIVTLDTTSGAIVATVGSVPYDQLQFDLVVDGRRQPGSVVKGITTVAALAAGHRPEEELDARGGPMPIDAGPNDTPWVVAGSGRATRPLDSALRWSDNAAFARLGLDLGVDTVAATARALGVESDFGTHPAALLGGAESCCTPLELAVAYATIGSLGTRHPPTVVSHVTDADGTVVWRADTAGIDAVDAVIAWEAATLLTGVVDAGTGRAAAVPGATVAGKTGTTTDNTDAWFVGTTPTLTTAVWVGHHDSRRRAVVDGVPVRGGGPPARIFGMHMATLLAGVPDLPFTLPPDRVVVVDVDVETGLRAGRWCGETEARTFPDTRVPRETCPSPAPDPPVCPSVAAAASAPAEEPTLAPRVGGGGAPRGRDGAGASTPLMAPTPDPDPDGDADPAGDPGPEDDPATTVEGGDDAGGPPVATDDDCPGGAGPPPTGDATAGDDTIGADEQTGEDGDEGTGADEQVGDDRDDGTGDGTDDETGADEQVSTDDDGAATGEDDPDDTEDESGADGTANDEPVPVGPGPTASATPTGISP